MTPAGRPGSTRVVFRTLGCRTNQYDTERMRQALEARGARTVDDPGAADVLVLNTCTVTNAADADARRQLRRLHREHPELQVVVAGCSAALHAPVLRGLPGVRAVVPGHDPVEVAEAAGVPPRPLEAPRPLVALAVRSTLDRMDREPMGGALLLDHHRGRSRAWLKIQDGCDRKCAFCATRIARGASRSRPVEAVVREAQALARHHAELVLTGIHIGHWGRDLPLRPGLADLLGALLDAIPDRRFRLGSIEATEVTDDLLALLVASGPDRVAPHLHMPLQSGADPVLRRMRRWHTRDDYRRRALVIAEALAAQGPTTLAGGPILGLGADLITGFPGETDVDHRDTVRLVEELPFTYLHVFPFSPREGTEAARLAGERPVAQRVAAERARELRTLAESKGAAYVAARVGAGVGVALEREGDDGSRMGLTEDFLRLPVRGVGGGAGELRLYAGVIRRDGDRFLAEVGSGRERSATAEGCETRGKKSRTQSTCGRTAATVVRAPERASSASSRS